MKKILLSLFAIFAICSLQAQNIADFENWHNYNGGLTPLQIPNGWSATDSSICGYGLLLNFGATFHAQVSKETPGNGGSSTAIKVTTVTQPALTGIIGAGPMPCLASNSVIGVDQNAGFTFTGGTPFNGAQNGNPTSASMWVKNSPMGGDSNEITIFAIDDADGGDSIAYIADTILGATITNFTQITIPFNEVLAGYVTTKLRVIISSSSNFGLDTAFYNLNDGSYIVVDDIEISSPNGIKQYLLSSNVAKVYPTAVQDKLYVNLQQNDREKYTLLVCDMQGKKIKSFPINETLNTLDMGWLDAGNYILSMYHNSKIVQTGKITKK